MQYGYCWLIRPQTNGHDFKKTIKSSYWKTSSADHALKPLRYRVPVCSRSWIGVSRYLQQSNPRPEFSFRAHTSYVAQYVWIDCRWKTEANQRSHFSSTDTELQSFLHVIQNGWPDHKNQLPENLKPYFALRDTLSCEASIVLKGERVVIPLSQRNTSLHQLHAAHLGAESMIRRERATVFWLGLNKDLKQMANNCHICQKHKPSN